MVLAILASMRDMGKAKSTGLTTSANRIGTSTAQSWSILVGLSAGVVGGFQVRYDPYLSRVRQFAEVTTSWVIRMSWNRTQSRPQARVKSSVQVYGARRDRLGSNHLVGGGIHQVDSGVSIRSHKRPSQVPRVSSGRQAAVNPRATRYRPES